MQCGILPLHTLQTHETIQVVPGNPADVLSQYILYAQYVQSNVFLDFVRTIAMEEPSERSCITCGQRRMMICETVLELTATRYLFLALPLNHQGERQRLVLTGPKSPLVLSGIPNN